MSLRHQSVNRSNYYSNAFPLSTGKQWCLFFFRDSWKPMIPCTEFSAKIVWSSRTDNFGCGVGRCDISQFLKNMMSSFHGLDDVMTTYSLLGTVTKVIQSCFLSKCGHDVDTYSWLQALPFSIYVLSNFLCSRWYSVVDSLFDHKCLVVVCEWEYISCF